MKYATLSILMFVLAACHEEDLVTPDLKILQIDTNQVHLTVSETSVPADGIATIQVRFSSAGVRKNFSSVVFSISPIGTFASGDTIITAPLDINGNAGVLVRSAGKEGIAFVRAIIGGYTLLQQVTFTHPRLTDTLNLAVTIDNVPADDYSYAHLRVSAASPDTILRMKTVTFQADRGVFANGQTSFTTNAGLNGVGDAYLRYNKAERALVNATIAGAYTRQASVNFVRAWPNTLSIEPTAGTIVRVPGTTIGVNARLTRIYGLPTAGIPVTFRDSSSIGSVGTFLNSGTSNSAGTATTTYVLQDTSFIRGYIYIIGVVDTGGGVVRGVNKIWVQ